MKHLLLCALVSLLSISFVSAQICEPDQMYADSSFGVYPAGIDESACINQPYYYSLTFVIPEEVQVGPATAEVDTIKLTGVSGLPEGMTYACNPPSCFFVPEDTLACAYIYGTASVNNAPGDYELELEGEVVTNLQTITFATLFALLGLENYSITLEEENSGTCLVNTVEPLNKQISIETSPNPFRFETTIEINSEINERLQFEVYTMLGKRIHAEAINLNKGTNTLEFDGTHLSAGVYFFNFSDGQSLLTQRMVVQR